MKKILIQYLYIFVIASVILFLFTWASACEVEEVKTQDLPICEEYQVSTEEKPCKKDDVSISTIGEAIKKLGESGTLPK
jgi:hypothetical protein